MRLNLFVLLFCSIVGASIGIYRVLIYSDPVNQLNILVLQTKDGAKLFDRPSSSQILEKILHQKIKITKLVTIEDLKNKLLSAQANDYDLISLDYKSFKIIESEGLTGIWSDSFDDILLSDLLVSNPSGNALFVPLTWHKIPFFSEGLAVPQKLLPNKIQNISLKIKKMIIHPGFQKILSLLPFGITIKDSSLIAELRTVIPNDRKASGLLQIPLSER